MPLLTTVSTTVIERDTGTPDTFIYLEVPAIAIGSPAAGVTLHGLIQEVLNGTDVLSTLTISPTDLGGSDFDIIVNKEIGASTRYLLPILAASMGDYTTGGTVIEGTLHDVDGAEVLILPIFTAG